MSNQDTGACVRLAAAAAVLLSALAGCGGGGGGGGGSGGAAGGSTGGTTGGTSGGTITPPGGGANATSTYLFYTNSDNSFNAIDPAVPATVINVVAASSTPITQDMTQVEAGSFATTGTGAPGSNTVSDLHTDSWVFENTGTNALNKVSALKGSTPTPVRLSSVSFGAAGTATAYCATTLQVYPDYQNIGNSLVVFGQAGPDNLCGSTDDTVSYTTLGASATTAPTTITSAATPGVHVLHPIYNLATGAISGALVLIGVGTGTTNLVKTDATLNLATATTVATAVTYTVAVMTTNAKGQMLLAYNLYLYAYDPAQPVSATNPKQLGTTQVATNLPFLSDGNNAYFLSNAPANNILNRVPLDGSALPTVMYTAPITETLSSPWQRSPSYMLTANRVVFAWYDSSIPAYGIASVPKSASGLTAATALNPTIANATWNLHSVAGTAVNFNSGITAYHANEDGTGLTTPTLTNQVASNWEGRIRPTSMALDQYDGSTSLRAVMRAQTFNLATGTNGMALAAYDVASGIQTANLGTIPASLGSIGEYLANNYSSIFSIATYYTSSTGATVYYSQGVFLNTNASATSVFLLPDPSRLNQNLVGENGH